MPSRTSKISACAPSNKERSVPVIQACGLVFAAVFVTLNTLADVLAILLNPGLRHAR